MGTTSETDELRMAERRLRLAADAVADDVVGKPRPDRLLGAIELATCALTSLRDIRAAELAAASGFAAALVDPASPLRVAMGGAK